MLVKSESVPVGNIYDIGSISMDTDVLHDQSFGGRWESGSRLKPGEVLFCEQVASRHQITAYRGDA